MVFLYDHLELALSLNQTGRIPAMETSHIIPKTAFEVVLFLLFSNKQEVHRDIVFRYASLCGDMLRKQGVIHGTSSIPTNQPSPLLNAIIQSWFNTGILYTHSDSPEILRTQILSAKKRKQMIRHYEDLVGEESMRIFNTVCTKGMRSAQGFE